MNTYPTFNMFDVRLTALPSLGDLHQHLNSAVITDHFSFGRHLYVLPSTLAISEGGWI